MKIKILKNHKAGVLCHAPVGCVLISSMHLLFHCPPWLLQWNPVRGPQQSVLGQKALHKLMLLVYHCPMICVLCCCSETGKTVPSYCACVWDPLCGCGAKMGCHNNAATSKHRRQESWPLAHPPSRRTQWQRRGLWGAQPHKRLRGRQAPAMGKGCETRRTWASLGQVPQYQHHICT